MFLRLMLLVPMIRQFMLLDIGVMPYDSEDYVEPPYKQLDDLVALHARAMLHMHELGWPLGSEHAVEIGEHRVVEHSRRGWFTRTTWEPTHCTMFGVSAPGGIIIMRSGAIYGYDTDETLKTHGRRALWKRPLDIARMDEFVRRDVQWALEHLLSLSDAANPA